MFFVKKGKKYKKTKKRTNVEIGEMTSYGKDDIFLEIKCIVSFLNGSLVRRVQSVMTILEI